MSAVQTFKKKKKKNEPGTFFLLRGQREDLLIWNNKQKTGTKKVAHHSC